MTNTKSLVDGIGNQIVTEKYYDDWALDYDQTLKNWNYKAPLRAVNAMSLICLLYTSPSPRDRTRSRMPSSA